MSENYTTDSYGDQYQSDVSEAQTNDDPPVKTVKPAKRGLDRAAVKKIIAKYEELSAAGPEHLELLATALNVPNTTADLTAAVMVGNRAALTGLTDTLALAVYDEPFDAIVSAISLGRTRIRGVWAVLAEMGALSGTVPSADVKAGGAVARAASEMDISNKTEIAAVLALAKK